MCYLPDLGQETSRGPVQNCNIQVVVNFKEINMIKKLVKKEVLKRARFAHFNGPEYNHIRRITRKKYDVKETWS